MENLQHTGRINFVLEEIKKKYKIEETEIKYETLHSYESDARVIFEYLKSNFSNEKEVQDLIIELEKENY